MNTRERQTQERTVVTPAPADIEPEQRTAAGDTGDAFLVAADAAIERALSASPEQFLIQNRQLSGQ